MSNNFSGPKNAISWAKVFGAGNGHFRDLQTTTNDIRKTEKTSVMVCNTPGAGKPHFYHLKRKHPTSPKVHYSEGSLVRRVRVRVRVRVGVKGYLYYILLYLENKYETSSD